MSITAPHDEGNSQVAKRYQRILDAAAQIYGESAVASGDLGFVHTLHANCYLPRRRLNETSYVHENGPYSILLEAGKLLDPGTRQWVDQPLPYGGKPRALLAYINTYAKANNTRSIPLGSSFTDFVRLMSGSATGGKRGSINLWKQQMMALAASTIRIGVSFGDRARVRKIDFADEIDVWFSPEPNQSSLFPSEIQLTDKYFDVLRDFAMPVDLRALRVLQNDPLAFDIYVWLTYRLCQVKKRSGLMLTWQVLFQQFGGGYSELRFFKRRFNDALLKAHACYPTARLDETGKGVIIKNSPSPILDASGKVYRLPSNL